VSFATRRGETFCIIGENGSGKSTLLQMVAGILQPSRGSLAVHGRVSALLELGAGFNPEFTGRDNVYLNGSILGLSTRQIDQRYADIADFAEIGDFIDAPVKQYSSGMYMRLAFSVATEIDPAILLIDEILAVGDVPFQQKCFERIQNFRKAGKTILLVSHTMQEVSQYCDRAILIERGSIAADGRPDEVIEIYRSSTATEVVGAH